MKRILTFLVCLVLLLSLSPRAQALSLDAPCSLSIRLMEEEKVVPGGSLTIYRAADVSAREGSLEYTLTDDFAPSGASLQNLNDPALPKTLGDFAVEKGLTGWNAGPGEDGVTVFSGLEAGLYLVTQGTAPEGYCPISPFVVNLPATSADGTRWVYDLEASPKVAPLPVTPPEPVDIAVKKVWDDSGKNRPSSVKIGLFAGQEQVDSVKLSSQNGWEHSWYGLEGGRDYEVRELNVPKGYTATYRIREGVVTVTNTATLIQTGQLNWPIPLLAVCGLALLLMGMLLVRSRKVGIFLTALATLLILGAMALLLGNRAEADQAGEAAQAVLPQMQMKIHQRREEKNEAPPMTAPPEPHREMTVTEIDGQEYVGCLSLPSLELELPVMADWSYEKLKTAPCRQTGTVAGEDLVIAGHNYDHHFGRFSSLVPGDLVLFTDMDGSTTVYEVALTEILQPDQVEEMLQSQYPLSLYTCTYGGKTRVTVRCREASEK